MDNKYTYPVDPKYPITFKFGEAPNWYVKVAGYPHNGLDFGCPVGTSVRATDEGKIIFADDIPDADGKGLIIQHSWGISLYWHLDVLYAKMGESCSKGQIIALSGKTGWVTGPHLHFAIKVTQDPAPNMRGWTDPQRYLTQEANQPTLPPPVEKYHIVLPGDSLWTISEKYYGNGFNWRRIYLANQNQIPNPNIIYPLMRLRIP